MSLAELSHATRIGTSYLEALEADRFADLPAPVFVRGFIRAYCEHLGEPAVDALDRYGRAVGAPRVDRQATRPADERRPLLGPASISLILVIVLGLSLIALTQFTRDGQDSATASRVESIPTDAGAPVGPATSPPPPGEAPAASPPPAPVPMTSAAIVSAPAPSAAGDGPFRLGVKAVETTWIRVQSEDQVVSELLPPGATRSWTSRTGFVLTVGNAAGVHLTLNDRAMPPLGERGVVIRRLEIPGRPDPAR
jgi:cytoskeletal protein RodZ